MHDYASHAGPSTTPSVVDPERRLVVSLFGDRSELAPWAAAGFHCVAFTHESDHRKWRDEGLVGAGRVRRDASDLTALATPLRERVMAVIEMYGTGVAFACASPPSRDLSVAGARHWKRKRERNPDFQRDAVALVREIAALFDELDCPYYIANPASSQLRRLWREPNYAYQPYEYGGYLQPRDKHPLYPEQIPAQDAYSQQQGLWTGGGFRMPVGKPVDPTWKYFVAARGGGGAAQRRRMSPVLYGNWNARAARATTPRGFAKALYLRLVGEYAH